MISMAGNSIRPIIDSQGGIHLSIYIDNTHDANQLRLQLADSLETIREKLLPVSCPSRGDTNRVLIEDRLSGSSQHG